MSDPAQLSRGSRPSPAPWTRITPAALLVGLVLVIGQQSPATAQEPPPNPVAGPPATPTTELPPAGCPDGPAGPALPGTRCPDGSVPTPPIAPPGCPGGLPDPIAPGTVCPDGSEPRDRLADRRLRNILGLDENTVGHPLEAYDIGCDEGSWNAFLRKAWCASQALPFAMGKWAIGVGTDLMAWALEFQMADALGPVAGALSQVYDTSLIGPLGLRQLAWTLAMFVAGWHLLRSRAARGASEIATTFLIATIGSILLANPQGYLEGSVALAQNTSGAVLEAVDDTMQTTSTDPGGSEVVRDRLSDILRRSFVAEPYDLINWGEPLTGECAAARDEILERGPWGADDEPREIMRDHGCDEQADFNHEPTDSRAAGSVIVMFASVATTVLLVAIALVVMVAQLTLVACFGGASLVWVLALFPGVGRDLLWWWLGRLAWAVMATIAATFVLSWLAITITATLAATSDISIIQRSLVVLLVVAFGYRLRAHLSRHAGVLSRRFGDRVAAATGNPASSTGFAAGAATGVGLSAMARSWALDAPGGQYAYNRLYARHFTRSYRHRGGLLRRTGRLAHRASATDLRATRAGLNAARAVGRGARVAALAPVLGPRAIAATRGRVTAASARARARLAQAGATRQQWTRNAAHPVQAVRTAVQPPTRPPPARRPGPPPARPTATPTRATGVPPRVAAARERVRSARAAARDRGREQGSPVRALLDAHREAAESKRPPDPHATLEAQRQAVADARRAALEQRARPPVDPDDAQDWM